MLLDIAPEGQFEEGEQRHGKENPEEGKEASVDQVVD
jgi:hypothetical protein